MTLHLLEFYKQIDPNLSYSTELNPRRILTNPSEGKFSSRKNVIFSIKGVDNDGYDNKDNNLILRVNDSLVHFTDKYQSNIKNEYKIAEFIGKGTFGTFENNLLYIKIK